ncbi:D-aminoacyl-tRNA deacylase [Bifidobacterium dolichotidis]|nr:D-aminoacyl-tRNA deacylase [Bifidobacterium dolichotidis]
MRIVLQKVSQAHVDVVDEQTGEVDQSFTPQHIDTGYMLLVAVKDTDGEAEVNWLAKKIAHLRVFEDAQGKMNTSLTDVHGQVLSISQFTLYGNVRKGNRPSFIEAGSPAHAEQIWHDFNHALAAYGFDVFEGRFGAHMRVSLTNDGPVTILFDTETDMPKKSH